VTHLQARCEALYDECVERPRRRVLAFTPPPKGTLRRRPFSPENLRAVGLGVKGVPFWRSESAGADVFLLLHYD
jgi:hypothetical protein